MFQVVRHVFLIAPLSELFIFRFLEYDLKSGEAVDLSLFGAVKVLGAALNELVHELFSVGFEAEGH